MNRAEATLGLDSDDSDLRLQSARYFARHARRADAEKIRRAHSKENVRWIKRALDRALEVAMTGYEPESLPAIRDVEPERLVSVLRQVKAEAVQEVAGTVIHEFSTLIGVLRAQAQAEVPNYLHSETYKALEHLSALVAAVRGLKSAASSPNYSQFDLAALVRDLVADNLSDTGVDISIAGHSPFLIESDRDRLGLAIVNGLRNAAEAVEKFSRIQPPQIVINWGRAGAESWLVIIDTGTGFNDNIVAAPKLGSTNKEGHFGFGLATAKQAMQSIEGDLTLGDTTEGGARFELRWFSDANFVR